VSHDTAHGGDHDLRLLNFGDLGSCIWSRGQRTPLFDKYPSQGAEGRRRTGRKLDVWQRHEGYEDVPERYISRPRDTKGRPMKIQLAGERTTDGRQPTWADGRRRPGAWRVFGMWIGALSLDLWVGHQCSKPRQPMSGGAQSPRSYQVKLKS